MNRLLILVGILMVALTVAMPRAAFAGNSMDVYVANSNQAVSESDVLRYAATEWQNGYINELFTMSQATMQARMDWLRQQASIGFDPNLSDSYLYSLLLPNSATLAQTLTWFGHPVVMMDGNYVIKDWFGPGNDAIVHPTIEEDIRTDSSIVSIFGN